MAVKTLPTGTANSPWKRIPGGVFNPGNPALPIGRNLLPVQTLIQNVFLAANQKNMTIVCSAELLELTGGVVSRQYNLCKNRIDYVQATVGNRPLYTASDAGFGGKPCISNTSARHLLNATDPSAPASGTPWTGISVVRLDSWPPGGRCFYGSSANRFGIYTTAAEPDTVFCGNSNNTPNVNMPLGRAGVLHYQMTNQTTDFVRFGPTLNTGTGVAVGNTNPASLAKFAVNTGAQGVVGSEAIQFCWTTTLTGAEHNAIDDLLNTYFGGGLQIYSTTGNVRSAGCGWLGSSQTAFNPGAGVNYQGARWRFFTQQYTTNNYPIWTSGLSSAGNWAQPAHTGISSLGINASASGGGGGGGYDPGAGLAASNAYLDPAGVTPSSGAGKYRWIDLELGGADILYGVYVPTTTANDLLAIAVNLATKNPRANIAINTICPQSGNPPNALALTNEIRGVGGVWDQFDALFPARLCCRVDLSAAVSGGTDLYVVANFADAVHLNQTGQLLWGDEINTKSAAAMNTQTLY